MALDTRLQSALKGLSENAVTLGIRPEDIHIGLNGGNSVETQVELVEPLGNHALLYLRTDKNSFVAQSDLMDVPQHNAPLTVSFNMDKAHLFHPETGNSLCL